MFSSRYLSLECHSRGNREFHRKRWGVVAETMTDIPRSHPRHASLMLREKLVKIGAKVISSARYVVFQMAEVAVPRGLFRAILERIHRLWLPETVPR